MKNPIPTLALVFYFLSAQAQVSNVLPMFGPGQKTDQQKEIDEEFIQTVLGQYGTSEAACEAHIDFAWRYLYNKDTETAMKRFNQAWLLESEYPDSYYGFSVLLRLNNNPEEADRFEKMAVNLDPSLERAKECYRHAANCLEQYQIFEQVIYYYSKLIELSPNDAFNYKKRGYFYSKIGLKQETLADYDQALALDPNDALMFNNRGYQHQLAQSYEKAIQDYSSAISIQADHIGAHINRALTYNQMGLNNEALADLERCIELDANHGPFYSLKGRILLDQGKNKQACQLFEKAISLGDTSIIDLFNTNCQK